MAKLFIPACGDRLTLTQPWSFDLYLEHRNTKFAEIRKLFDGDLSRYGSVYVSGSSEIQRVPVILPVGTVLECNRVYIRQGSKSSLEVEDDYDSITWRVMKGTKPATHQRFWAKLSDCCKIEYSLAPDGFYRDRVKAVKIVMES